MRFERGLTGTIEASRVAVGPQARYAFEVHGTEGAVAWDFERMNELLLYLPLVNGDAGYARVPMGPQHPFFGRFQPGPGLSMGYDDLKVIEAGLFLQSVIDGVQREPGVRRGRGRRARAGGDGTVRHIGRLGSGGGAHGSAWMRATRPLRGGVPPRRCSVPAAASDPRTRC